MTKEKHRKKLVAVNRRYAQAILAKMYRVDEVVSVEWLRAIFNEFLIRRNSKNRLNSSVSEVLGLVSAREMNEIILYLEYEHLINRVRLSPRSKVIKIFATHVQITDYGREHMKSLSNKSNKPPLS